MELKELLDYQQTSGNLLLQRQGLFFMGYNALAYQLHKTMGYMLKSRNFKTCGCTVYYVGFPSSSLDKVLLALRGLGGGIVRQDKNSVEFSGLTVVCDEFELNQHAVASVSKCTVVNENDSLSMQILNFNLIGSTPIECMMFLDLLQSG